MRWLANLALSHYLRSGLEQATFLSGPQFPLRATEGIVLDEHLRALPARLFSDIYSFASHTTKSSAKLSLFVIVAWF